MTALLERPSRSSVDRPSTVRSLVNVGLGPALTTVAVVTAVVLVVLVAGGVDLRGTAVVVAAAWLGAHQVPLTITGVTLGVLPLLPTLLLVWVTARSVAATGTRGRRCAWVAGAAVGGPVLVAVLAVVVLTVAPAGLAVAPPQGVGAVLRVAAVHATGTVLGLARPSGQLARLRRALPGWAWSGLVRVPELLAVLVAAGTVLTTLALVRGFSAAATLVGTGGGAGGALGLVLLSTAYLPNVAVGALSFAVGPGAVLGSSTVTPFGAVPGRVPPLPVLAGLPTGTGAGWWVVVLVVPAAVGGLLGWRVLRVGASRGDALRSVGVAAVVTGVLVGLLGQVAGGRLGTFTPVGVPVLGLAVATVVWLAVVGGATVLALEWAEDDGGAPVDEAEVTEDEVAAVELTGDEVAGDEVAGDEVAGDEVAGDEVAAVEVAGDEVDDPVSVGQSGSGAGEPDLRTADAATASDADGSGAAAPVDTPGGSTTPRD